MTSSRIRAAAVLLALAAAVAGCTSTTAGTGDTTGSGAASSTPDFPSGAAPATTDTSAPGTPTAAAPTSTGPSTHPVPASPLKTATVHAGATTYVVKIWADVHNDTCFDHAFGRAMIDFLTRHPCTGLERFLGTTTVHGNPAAFAESVTGFRGTTADPYVNANAFTRLEQADGTGSIDDLLREGYRLPVGPSAVPASEAFDVIGQDDGVTVWDAWYVGDTTPPNDPALMQMMKDIFLQF